MENESTVKLDFECILSMKKHFSKFLSEHVDEQYPPTFCMFAEALLEKDFSSQQELSDFLEVNKAHTSRTLFKMHAKGLVKLEPKRIFLTDKGKKFAVEAKENKQNFINTLLEGLSKEDLAIFSRIINQIISNAKKFEKGEAK